jgi:outer membrane protein TolC
MTSAEGVGRAMWLALLVSGPGVLAAEPVPLTLDQALQMAGRQNPEVQAQAQRAAAAVSDRDAARRARWPRLSLASGWWLSDTPSMVFAGRLDSGEFRQQDFAISSLNDPAALSHLGTALQLEAPIDLSGSAGARAESLSLAAEAARLGHDELTQDVRLGVVESYRRAALAERMIGALERAVEGARAREADVHARVVEGASLAADLMRARARRRQREADLAERRGDRAVALARLARAIGASAVDAYRPVEAASAPAPLEGDGASWSQRALAGRPAVAAARRHTESRSLALRAEDRSKWPDLAAWGRVQDDRITASGGSVSGAVGVSLRWNLLDFSRSPRVAAAASAVRAADLSAQAVADQVRLEVETAWHRAQAARERYAAAAGGAEEGREALRVIRERRQQGLATLTDELETEAASLGAEIEELRAATEAAIADAALRRAAGAL